MNKIAHMMPIQQALYSLKDKEEAQKITRFFKCGKGEYSEGDCFLGIKVPKIRQVAKTFGKALNVKDCLELLKSPYHEERHLALILLVSKFPKNRDEVYKLYLDHTQFINNWDLVDVSAAPIVGAYLENRPKEPLFALAISPLMWERRIAIVATHYFIKKKEFEPTLKIAKLLLGDEHDLIHKAVGWMLREMGKQDQSIEEEFLNVYGEKMPRTMLRYAIEKFEMGKRQYYMQRR